MYPFSFNYAKSWLMLFAFTGGHLHGFIAAGTCVMLGRSLVSSRWKSPKAPSNNGGTQPSPLNVVFRVSEFGERILDVFVEDCNCIECSGVSERCEDLSVSSWSLSDF